MARNLIKRFNVQKHAFEHDKTRNEGKNYTFSVDSAKKSQKF